ncbi:MULTISPECIES: hypothetical protein [Shewanella]|uniref:hypothetical protein n=1 Tax=Shewanella TaxID=22 RepID=UPI00285AC76C|nr:MULTISPECIES: hypothetical protein [Shewanella]MDR6965730.1 hypothetical protein [Shewanella putrefaciens]WVI93398.1 hypothetical protein VR487_21740 [Shewanella oncorhynchi]
MREHQRNCDDMADIYALKELLKHAERDISCGRTLSSEEIRENLKELAVQFKR